MKDGMSATRTAWNQFVQARETYEGVTTTPDQTPERIFEEIYGPFFYKGLDIGQQVMRKLEAGRVDGVWPTLLHKFGEDGGLTAGFLTACEVSPIIGLESDEPEQGVKHLADLAESMSLRGIAIVTTDINILGAIPDKFAEYRQYPSQQGWSLPGVWIDYSLV